jgi:BioD-like phosphotransacetylase family protein
MMAGIVLTGDLPPNPSVLKVIRAMPIPVLLTAEDSYRVASKVHDLTVKTRPTDAGKISLIRDLVATRVDIEKILSKI